jgi:hypothetical protein
MPRRRDGDRDERAWLVDQAVALGRRLMAQNGIGPGPEQGCPENGLSRGSTGEGRVYAPLKSLPPAVTHPGTHRARIDARVRALTSGDGIALDR